MTRNGDIIAAVTPTPPPEIRYVTGDASAPLGDDTKVIAHICNDAGAWGRGFVRALSARWSGPELAYRAWHRHGEDFRLGAVQLVNVGPSLWIANMLAQHGIARRGATSTSPIRYSALEECLTTLADHADRLQMSAHMPRIGTGLAGGTWDRIEPLITARLLRRQIPVTIYDLQPPSSSPDHLGPGAQPS